MAQIEILFDNSVYACIIGSSKSITDNLQLSGKVFNQGLTGAIYSHIKVTPYM